MRDIDQMTHEAPYSVLSDRPDQLSTVCFQEEYIPEIDRKECRSIVKKDGEVDFGESKIVTEELAYLKSQFNAHMTFNVLTDIYSKIYQVDREAARTLELFSEILHHLVSSKRDEKVPLEIEIRCIECFIELQRTLNESVHVEFSYENKTPEEKIFPRILMGLVENAFKHGASNDPNHPLKLHLFIDEAIHFRVENIKSKQKRVHSNGIGIKNMVDLLDICYRGRYYLEVEEDASSYSCQLTLG